MSDLYITNRSVSYRNDLCRVLSDSGFKIIQYEQGGHPIRTIAGKVFLKGPVSLLRRERPSYVIVPEFSGIAIQMALFRKRFGFKVLSLCDDSLDMIQGNDLGRLHRFSRRIVPRFLDGIITLGPAVADWYSKHCGLKSLWVPLIADEERVRGELKRLLPLSGRLRPGPKPIVAYVGRLVGLKNIPTLIRAFEPLKACAQLVIIGDGVDREMLTAMAPDALFTGMQTGDDLLAWYNLIDILVLPSTLEPYGAVIGEALMAGAKVVVSRLAGSADLVREGENGYLVDPMDVPGLTNRLKQLLDSVPEGRELSVRENLLPYRFEPCVEELIRGINSI